MIAAKLKELSKDTAIYGISTILGRFLNFLLVPFYTNVFLPEEYGIIGNIYAVIALLNIIYLYGMDSAFMKYAADKEELSEREIFSTPYLSVAVSSVILSLILIFIQQPLFGFLGVPQEYNSLIYFMASILLADALSAIPYIKLRLEKKAKKFATFKFLNILVTVLLNIILVLILDLGLEAVFISNLIASLFTLVLLIPEIRKYLKIEINKELMKKLLKFGIPYLPAGFSSIIIQVIDRPILEQLTDLHTVGIYQANHRLGIFMMLFVNMFQFAWQPFFLQNAKEERAKEIFSKVLTYFTLAGSLILVFLSLFIEDIIKIDFFGRSLIGSAYWSGVVIVPVVLLGYLFNGIYYILSAGIFIKEKTIYIPFITAGGAIINIAVNIALIPLFDIMGSAIAAFASYLFMALSLYVITQKFYKIEYELSKIAGIFLSIAVATAGYFWLSYQGSLTFGYKILLMILFIVIVSTNVFDRKELNVIKTIFIRKRG